MMTTFRMIFRTCVPAAALALALVLTACGGQSPSKVRSVVHSGNVGTTTGATRETTRGLLSENRVSGIRDYGDYQTVLARQGDTVARVARRIGLSAKQLSEYNGLPQIHILNAGEELVLPPRPGGYGTTITAGGDFRDSSGEPLIVATPLDGQSAETDDAWSPEIAAQAIARSSNSGNLAIPRNSAPSLPANSETLGSPQPRTQPGTDVVSDGGRAEENARIATGTSKQPISTLSPGGGARFLRPVEGTIAIGYGQGSGSQRSSGIDFAAEPGTPVIAADDGDVWLVSEGLGNLGTIVMLRHADGLLTAYGRLTGVSLTKGTSVSRGQQIGEVAVPPPDDEARMHFQVLQADAETLDPAPFLEGG